MTSSPERYAVYWAPGAGHPLWRAGCDWLGRDPAATRGAGGHAPRAHVATPARYGFHATLKAPFRLAAGASTDRLREACAALAARHRSFEMPALEVAWLGDFLALRPVSMLQASHPLRRLADACVAELDDLRALAEPGELARHAAAAGEPGRIALLERWGYPHVFEAWRFHMTLSDRFADRATPAARGLEAEARAFFATSLERPLRAEDICVFQEAGRGHALRLIERLPLADVAGLAPDT